MSERARSCRNPSDRDHAGCVDAMTAIEAAIAANTSRIEVGRSSRDGPIED
jgi:hypothetical protein